MVDSRQASSKSVSETEPIATATALQRLQRAEIGVSPELELTALTTRREEVTPPLLREINKSQQALIAEAEHSEGERHTNFLHTIAIYMLALFEEPRGFQPLVQFLAEDTHVALEMLGDIVTEDLAAILARLYDGSDLKALKAIIEDDDNHSAVRGACLRSLHVMTLTGKLGREDVVTYYAHMLTVLRTPANAEFADLLALATAEMLEPQLKALILSWFEAELVDPWMMGADSIESIYQRPRAKIESQLLRGDCFDSLPAYLSSWAWFTSDDPEEFAIPSDDFDDEDGGLDGVMESRRPHALNAEPLTGPKVGRNDPCPCGSGQKYKKCCLS